MYESGQEHSVIAGASKGGVARIETSGLDDKRTGMCGH